MGGLPASVWVYGILQGGFLPLPITVLGGGHISGPLLQDSFFDHVDPGHTENITESCAMGGTGKMKSILRVTLYAVLGISGEGGFGEAVSDRIFYGFETAEGIFKALNSLRQTTFSVRVHFVAEIKFLLQKSFFHQNEDLGIGGSERLPKSCQCSRYAILKRNTTFMFFPVRGKTSTTHINIGNTDNDVI
jgi:hypothetical protein